MSTEPKARRSPRIRRKGRTDRSERRKGEAQPVTFRGHIQGYDESGATGNITSDASGSVKFVANPPVSESPELEALRVPPLGSWAETARVMRSMFPDEDFDWDAWKDEMKERDLDGT